MSVLLPGGLIVLDAGESALFAKAKVARAIVAAWNDDGIVPPGLVSVLAMMREAASEAGMARPGRRGSGGGSEVGPKMDGGGSAASELMLTVHEAAEVAKVSERCIRKAIYSGRLAARRVGGGTRWVVTAASVEAYSQRRNRLKVS